MLSVEVSINYICKQLFGILDALPLVQKFLQPDYIYLVCIWANSYFLSTGLDSTTGLD